MKKSSEYLLQEYLFSFLTEERKEKIKKVLDSRTRYITVVLENIYQEHNASAVIRSCECFGVQDLHVIENSYSFNPSKNVTIGATKWIDLHHYQGKKDNSSHCLKTLKEKGYRIVATSPHKKASSMYDLELDKGKIALVFGTEQTGISEEAEQQADEFLYIPLYGFTESFNISVSVALVLQNLYHRLIHSKIDWHLTELEKQHLKLDWAEKIVRNSEILKRDFLSKLS